MANKYENDLLIRAMRGERTPRTPLWLMRQAGRTDPAYLRLKEESGLPLEKLFRHPDWSTCFTLLPKRYGVDALIYYQDILTPLAPMGADFIFRPGPVLETPIETTAQVDALEIYDVAKELPFVPETMERIRAELDGQLPLLGFAGAPLTLAVFMLESKSFGESADKALGFIEQHPDCAHRLLDKLSNLMIDYLLLQKEAGAAAVQLFESAAFLLSPKMYEEFALPYQQRIFKALRGRIPTIMFARQWDDLESLDESRADIISLPSSVSIAEARARLGGDRVLQGNLDNHLLAHGTLDEIREAAFACVRSGRQRGHIFNLSHGLLRETPQENILKLVQFVREAGD